MHLFPIVFIALLIVPIQDLRQPRGLIADRIAKLYQTETGRRVVLPPAGGAPFDVIVVHICSLGWDDLAAAGAPKPKLLEGASYVFTRFNSATSYSTPAALRLLRAPCGQVAHDELYRPWPKDCGLIQSLRDSGFSTYSLFNHTGGAYGMKDDLVKMAGLDEPVSVAGLPVQLINFDREPLLNNYPVLERWWTVREKSAQPRAALYYNTMSLHGGAHEDHPEWWNDPTQPRYVKSLESLGDDLERFYGLIAASGRSAVVLIVPEHGRALRGSSVQAKELRDMPLARITLVPAAVRFVGPLFAGAPLGKRVDAPLSYLGLAQLLADSGPPRRRRRGAADHAFPLRDR